MVLTSSARAADTGGFAFHYVEREVEVRRHTLHFYPLRSHFHPAFLPLKMIAFQR